MATAPCSITPPVLAEDTNSRFDTMLEIPKGNKIISFETPHDHPARLSDISEDEEEYRDRNSICESWEAISELEEDFQTPDNAAEGVECPSGEDYIEFYKAVTRGDVAFLRSLLELGLDLEREASRGFTALVIAIMQSRVDTVKLLLEKGADVHHRCRKLPPLVHAAMKSKSEGGPKMMQLLLDHGANLNVITGQENKNVLHWAASEGNADAVEFLISRGMDIEKHCERKRTPLILAAEQGFVGVARVLLDHGANINARSANGGTVLNWSSCNNHVEAVQFWLEQPGIDINATDNQGLTSLFLASHFGGHDTVKLLLDNGADPSILSKSPGEYSALMGAACANQTEIVRTLAERGCNVNATDNNGETALDIAIIERNPDAVEVLLEAIGGHQYPKESVALQMALSNGHVTMKSLMKTTALMYPHIGLKLEVPGEFAWLDWVLRQGGYLVKPRVMWRILHAALDDQDVELVRFLADRGCDMNLRLESGITALSYCVDHRNSELVQVLLDAGADPNKSSDGEYTPFSEAVLNMRDGKDTRLVDIFLKSGRCKINCGNSPTSTAWSHALLLEAEDWFGESDLAMRMLDTVQDVNNDRCDTGGTLLHVATFRGRKDIVDALLDKGVDIDVQDNEGVTPFLLACQQYWKGATSMMKFLIERGANVNAKYKSNATALHAVAVHGNVESLEFLVQYGLDVEARTERGCTPLAWAMSSGREEVALSLMHPDTDVHWKTGANAQTALHIASRHGLEQVVMRLLERGVEVDAKDVEGRTPLHEACATGTTDIVHMLLSAGADIELALPNGDRPLHIALINEQEAVAELLVHQGADLKVRASKKRTPLHLAAEFNLPNATDLLLRKGLSTEDIDEETWTPICCCGSPEVVKILLDAGANVNYADEDNWTPMHQAVSNGDGLITRMLLGAGAELDVRTTDDGLSLLERAEDLEDEKESEMFVKLLLEERRRRTLIEVERNILTEREESDGVFVKYASTVEELD